MDENYRHCEALVRSSDKDRFLATLFAPAGKRGPLFGLYAFNVEIASVRFGPGDLVLGFHFAGGLDGFTVRADPARAMTFRVRSLDRATGQIRVHPVVALGDDGAVISDLRPEIPHDAWARSGPTVPLRMEMRMYRWCLCFGEFVVNWQDLRSGPGQRPRSTT